MRRQISQLKRRVCNIALQIPMHFSTCIFLINVPLHRLLALTKEYLDYFYSLIVGLFLLLYFYLGGGIREPAH